MFKKKGFTLIELMVVIAIIAVLAAVVTPQVFKQIAKGRASAALSFAESVKTSSNAYFSDRGAWPGACLNTACNTAVNGFVTGGAANWDGPYLDRWPEAGRNPWTGNYNWNSVTPSANFGPAAVAPNPPIGERWIAITIPVAAFAEASTILDRAKDGALDGTLGYVRYGGAVPLNTVWLVVSRDGRIN